ncbi:MaoC family dehydratase [Dongshaea marina]|uniref:MaoC family dehydratase n=1 Tax=Dongshaea marina TaxID=2047966 RepID=UPI000D3E7671|nr:MaoC family dehydratase [Dongshaea marina]
MFSAYAKIDQHRYREIFGLDFEQFEKGQLFHHRPGITISQQDNVDEATDTMNSAQLHYDQHYASNTEWQHCLGVSTMTLQKVLGGSWKTFARKDRIIEFTSIAMTHPVFGGDTLYAESEILGVEECPEDECGILRVETRGTNQHGDIVTRVTYNIRIYKAGQHPYYGSLDCQLSGDKFSAYALQADGSLKESVGIYFEDLQPGELYEHAAYKLISPDEAISHAQRSLEWNPKYVDPDFYKNYLARPGESSLPPVTESYWMGAMTACTTRTLGRVVANLAWTDVKLHREVFPNEKLRVTSEIIDKRESRSRPDQGIVNVLTRCYDEAQQEVLSYRRTLLVYRKDRGPYEAAGY